jgi:hypothetical protein
LNIAGANPVSYYDFYRKLAELLNINHSFIVKDYRDKETYNNLDPQKRKEFLRTKIREITD